MREDVGVLPSPVDEHVPLGEVPSARPDDVRRRAKAELVPLTLLLVDVGDGPLCGVDQVDLSEDEVFPGKKSGVLDVGHKVACARVERVEDHFAVDGAGDVHTAIEEVLGSGVELLSCAMSSMVRSRVA